MLNFFGDGDRFSQKRLRAPQDVGLGRRKNFGNREYFGEEAGNRVDDDEYIYEDEEAGDFVEQEYETQNTESGNDLDDIDYVYEENEEENKTQLIEADNMVADNEYLYEDDEEYKTQNEDRSLINFDQVLQEIQRRLPQLVQNSLSEHKDTNINPHHEAQAVSTPADTIRLQPQEPGYVYEQVYPSQAPIIKATPSRNLLRPANNPPTQNYRQLSLEYHNQPKLAPILVEETREYKPVWTVTRERPQQILLEQSNRKKDHQQKPCTDKNCGKQRVLRKVKRKLIAEKKLQPQERRNELNKETQTSKGDLEENVENSYNMEEERAITLKEAYDRAIKKVDQSNNSSKEVNKNLLYEILNRDFREYSSEKYVNSDDIRFFDE